MRYVADHDFDFRITWFSAWLVKKRQRPEDFNAAIRNSGREFDAGFARLAGE
ncbi:MAG: hypothetical protein O3A00_28850 [Planctomycetota bacterium]|nr:hypothetical protein [Planctomycetota bacterium]